MASLKIEAKRWLDEREHTKQQLTRFVLKTINEPLLLEEQRQVLNEYYQFIMSNGTRIRSVASIRNVMATLCNFGLFIRKPYNQASRKDVQDFLFNLRTKGIGAIINLKNKGEPRIAKREYGSYSESSIIHMSALLKKFYKFLYGTDEFPPIVSWINTTQKRRNITEEGILTVEEVKRLVAACPDVQGKAFIMLLWESGARIGEALGVRISELIFDSYGAKVVVDGKTGRRQIRLIESIPYIQEWLNKHPLADDYTNYLFIRLVGPYYGRQLSRTLACSILKNAAKTAKIHKKIHPHIFRHSRLNHLGKLGFNERHLRFFAGWSPGSPMPEVYLHYGQEAVDNKLLEMAGKLTEDDKERQRQEQSALKPIKCPRCRQESPATAMFCSCGMALDLKSVMEETEKRENADRVMNELFADEGFKELLKGYLKSKVTLQ